MNTPNAAIHQLEEVFATFNRVSDDLSNRYRDLEGKVEILSEELSATRNAKLKELAAKKALASKLSALMEALPGGVIALDGCGRIKEENPTAAHLLGKSYLGCLWSDVLRECADAGELRNGELSLLDGKRISVTSSACSNNDTIILLTDVTENFQLNNLVNREKRLTALGEMSARLAHQIRTPLSSAILYLSHLSGATRDEKRDEKDSQTLGKIRNRLGQIEKMIGSMLAYIKEGMVEAGEFSLTDTLAEAREAFSQQVSDRQGRLECLAPDTDCRLYGNREAIYNALSNLIENALQACTGRPEIIIRMNPYNNWYDISVADNGPGIDDQIKEQVFDPFFSTRSKGTGLGLAVVSSAVKAHDGEVIVRDGKRGGTVFHLLLPQNRDAGSVSHGLWNSASGPLSVSK